MKTLTPMVAANFLKFSPISLSHEPPEKIPIRYSKTLFAEGIPPKLRPLFQERVRVHPLQKTDHGTWAYREGDALVPGRGICLEFEGLDRLYMYHLFATKLHSMDEESGMVRMINWIPDEPPTPEEFATWVNQSINQAAQDILRHAITDTAHAHLSKSFVCTDSPLIGELLAHRPGSVDLKTELANLTLRLELPLLSQVSVSDLMKVRLDSGEAFASFRTALERELRSVRSINDPSDRERRLEEIRHEFEEVQLRDVRRAAARIRREFLGEGVLAFASVAAVLQSGEATVLGLTAAAISSYHTSMRYLHELRAHPAYFLWRLTGRRERR